MIKQMTKSEKQVMELLWKADRPLSCAEIVDASDDKTWKDSYVHSLIKSLIKNGLVEIKAFELVSRSYARKFAPKITFDEYVIMSNFTEDEMKNPNRMKQFAEALSAYTAQSD